MDASIDPMSDVDDETFRTSSFCWVSRMESCNEEMLGCGGNEVSTADAFFDCATDEGRVSGSKSALRILLSFAESEVSGVWITILTAEEVQQLSRNLEDETLNKLENAKYRANRHYSLHL